MIIAQMSDPHISTAGCDFDSLYHTSDRLRKAVRRVNRLTPRPRMVVITGDLVNCGSDAEYANFSEVLAELEIPVLLGIGNHDDRAGFRRQFPDPAWCPDGQFIQYATELDGLRLIMLDTNVPGQPHGLLCDRRLQWLQQCLGEKPEMPTVLFMHHPPFDTGIAAMDSFGLRDKEAFAHVIRGQSQIKRIFCGHVHRPIQSVVAGIPAQICPSTSHRVQLHLQEDPHLATTAEPSEILLHLWDEAGGGTIVTHSIFTNDYPVLWEKEDMSGGTY
jgi:3',5'-cyclic AMP phosphodiesterase CpdA